MKSIIIFIIISLFCFNVYAKECKNPGGTYTVSGVLETTNCSIKPNPVIDLPDLTFGETKCGIDYQARLFPVGENCIMVVGMLIQYDEERISGYGLLNFICKDKKCETAYRLIMFKKEVKAEKGK